MRNKYLRMFLVAAGTLFMTLGLLGIFIPLLPTTPLLLIAAVCYANGSERLHHWLLSNSFFGKYIKDYLEGKGIPLYAKIVTCAALWLSIGYSVIFLISSLIVKGLLVMIALGVTVHLICIKTATP